MHKNSIIFDIEGTLVDSVSLTLTCWQETLENAGHHVSRAVLQKCSGMDGGDMLRYLLPDSGTRERKALLKTQGIRFERDYLGEAKPFPRVRDTLQLLKGGNCSLALATDCNGKVLRHYRDILDIDNLLHGVACGDDVQEGKPNPSVIAVALRKLGTPAGGCLMIGDTPSDAKAAKGEGMPCIGVLTGGFSAQALHDAGCLAVATNISALPVVLT